MRLALDDESARDLVDGHHSRTEVFREHGTRWVSCLDCGACWAVHGSTLERVSEGDGSCEDRVADADLFLRLIG